MTQSNKLCARKILPPENTEKITLPPYWERTFKAKKQDLESLERTKFGNLFEFFNIFLLVTKNIVVLMSLGSIIYIAMRIVTYHPRQRR